MLNWAYLAGFFDGEGTVGIQSNHSYGFSIFISLPQAGERGRLFLEEVSLFLRNEGLEPGTTHSSISKLSTVPCYTLRFCNRNSVEVFLANILPYLHVKKGEVQDSLRMMRLFPALPRGGKLSWEARKIKQQEKEQGATSIYGYAG